MTTPCIREATTLVLLAAVGQLATKQVDQALELLNATTAESESNSAVRLAAAAAARRNCSSVGARQTTTT